MSTDTPSGTRPAHSAARTLAVLVLVLGLGEAGFGVVAWVESARTTGDAAMFAGLGYILALVVGLPGVFAVVLGACGLAVGRNLTAAYVAAAAGTVVVAGPIVLLLALRF